METKGGTFDVTQAGIDAVYPGRTVADIFRAMATELSSKGQPEGSAGVPVGARHRDGFGGTPVNF
jgi:hypothetical protein